MKTPKHHLELLISEKKLQTRLEELARQIAGDYAGRELVLVGVLYGASSVMSDLGRYLWKAGLQYVSKDYISISSYAGGTKSTGKPKITKKLNHSVKGKHVLLVDDIVDTGLTLQLATKLMHSAGAESVEAMSVLSKPSRREVEVELKYIGFEIPDKFVVGYDLGYDEMYRTIPEIKVLVFD